MADYKTDFQIPGNLESINYVLDRSVSMEFVATVRLADADALSKVKFVVNVNDEPVGTKEVDLDGTDTIVTIPFEMADRDILDVQVANMSDTTNVVVNKSHIRKA